MTSPGQHPRRVAILKPCCIGDCIMALPAIDAVCAAWTEAAVDVFVGQHSAAAFAFRPRLTIRPAPDRLDFGSALLLSRELRSAGYDAVINLDRSRWLRLATRTSRASIQGSVESMSPEMRHESEVYLDVVRHIGVPTPVAFPVIAPDRAARQRAVRLLAGVTQPFVLLHPGGAMNPGATMLSKRWPVERFVRLAEALQTQGVDVLVSGGPGEVDVAATVANGAGLPDQRVLAGRVDLETLAGLLCQAAAYVGPDTGVSHLAAAVGTPSVVIFGPTNPRRYRPLGRDVQIVAPAESWLLPDRDLRKDSTTPQHVSTDRVSFGAVLDATVAAISKVPRQC